MLAKLAICCGGQTSMSPGGVCHSKTDLLAINLQGFKCKVDVVAQLCLLVIRIKETSCSLAYPVLPVC